MIAVSLNRGNSGEIDAARDRLHRNGQEVAVEHRALSSTDGAGGDFVPPLWAVNQWVSLARPSRVTADLVQNLTLPTGTDQINVPKMATGTAVAEQATQNTAVQNTDATTSTVTANVATLAGQQVTSVQLIEQSPVPVGDFILQDLIADLAQKTDLFVLNNNATGKKGLLQEAGTNAVTFTSGSPTAALFYSKLADARQQIETNRYASPSVVVMHPRRWAWLVASADTTGRPLINPEAVGAYNAMGVSGGATTGAGKVGTIAGLDVYIDSLIPTSLGAGTNQDVVIVMKPDDSILYEGTLNAEVFREPVADQLSVLFRVYRYAAFTTARQPKSISVINGTALVAPTL